MIEFRTRLRAVRMEKKKTEREPSIKKLIALADFFDVTLDYLMGRTEQ